MLSDTHHKSLDSIFAARDNQNLRRSLVPIGQTSPRGPQDQYHLLRQTGREVMVRNESKVHNNTDEIHVVVVRVDGQDNRCVSMTRPFT